VIETPPFARRLQLLRPYRQHRWPILLRRFDRWWIRAENEILGTLLVSFLWCAVAAVLFVVLAW
jgi:hypothetical protein